MHRCPSLLENVKALQRLFVDGKAKPRERVVEIDVTALGRRLAVEDVPEQFVSNLHVHLGKELRDGGVEAGHDHVIIVHLTSVGNDGNLERFGQGTDLACLADAADPVCVELNVIERICLEQFTKTENSELVLAACDRHSTIALQFAVSTGGVGDNGFLKPAQVEGLE